MKTKNFYLFSRTLFALSVVVFSFLPKVSIGATCGGDFTFTQDPCDPYTITFTASVAGASYNWNFGDATSGSGQTVVHTYTSYQVFAVTLTYSGSCTDVVTKNVPVVISPANIIYNNDTTICKGSSGFTLNTNSGTSSCWRVNGTTVSTNSSLFVNPTTTTTYVFNTRKLGTELVSNGNFSSGYIVPPGPGSFSSVYTYNSANGFGEGQYTVNTNPQIWQSGFYPIADHTTGSGNMLIVNGYIQPNKEVWGTTITVKPNTNYIFSTWLSNVGNQFYPPLLQFSINGSSIGSTFSSITLGLWQQFYTVWNSGSNTSANIQIVNQNTQTGGNDFVLDDISFIEAELKTESVVVTVLDPIAPAAAQTLAPTCIAGGTITVSSPAPQVGIFTYSIDGSTYTNTTGVFTGLNPGTYSVTYKNNTGNAGCISPATSVVISPRPANPTVTVAPTAVPICIGFSTTLTASGASTYSWSPSTTLSSSTGTSVTATPTSTTTYTVTGTDGNGCTNTASATVTVNLPPSAPTLSKVDPTCTVGTGSITVMAPTGSGETYSLDGGTYQSGATFSGVAPGSHSVTVKSTAGCISSATSIIIPAQPPTPVAPTVTPTQPTCLVATGTITISAPTGAGLTYSIDGSTYQGGTTFNNVTPNTYSVTVKNATGCISPATSVTINAQPPTPVAPTVTPTQPTCLVATGTITISAPTGAGLTYSIDGSTYQGGTTFNNVTPNTYSVTVKNATGCISPATSVTINAQPPTPVAPTVTPTQPTCLVATGTITISAPTGAGLTYSIDGSTYQGGTTFNNVTPNTYSVTVKNATGCISPATSVTINAQPPTPVAPTVTPTQPTCLVATGTITISAPTGAGLTYSIDGSTYQGGTTFNNVTPNTYSVTVKNATGCISPATSVTINAQPPTPVAPTVTPTQPTCLVATGTITVSAPTGAGLTYSIDGSTYTNTSGIFTGLTPNTYSVTVKNATGCISPATSVTINAQPATPVAPTVTPTQPTCTVATGTITISAPTGAGLTYSIDGSTYTNTSGIFTGLTPNTYSVTVKNATGCISPATSVTINAQPPTPAAPTLTPTQPTCTVATGSIVVTAPTGNGETYSLDGGSYQNGTTFSSVAPGSHSITVKSSAGCISPATSVTIDAQPPTPPAPTLTPTQPTCLVATGSIVVTAPTGNGETYSLDGGAYQNGTTFSSVAPGSHSITVKSSAGCISPATSVTINAQPATPPAPTLTPTQPTCAVATGSIVVTAPTGGGESYSLDGGAYQNGTTFSSVAPGSHSITVKSSAGCISPATSVTINAQPATPPAPTLTPTQPTCAVATGSIVVTAPTGGGESYSLDGGAYQNGTTFSSVAPGSHSITVKSSAGCISPATSVTIDAQPATPVAPTVTPTQPTCTVATGTITISAPTGAGLTYSIDGSTYTNTSGIFTGLTPNTYSVTVKNATGCISPATSVTINAQPPTPAAPTLTPTQPTCTVATGSIVVTAPTGNGETYSLDGGSYQNGTTFSSVAPGSHSITVKSSGGCISPATSVTIDAQPPTPPAPTLTPTQPTCLVATGSIVVTAPTGNGETYSLDGGAYQNGTTFSSVAPGSHSITVKSSAGCISPATSVTINAQPATPPAPTLTPTQPTCTVATGSIVVTAPTGGGESYSLDGGAYQNGTTFSSVAPGSHSITVKSSAGCISPATSVTINAQPATPPAPTLTPTQPTCAVATGSIVVTAPTGGGESYSLDGGAYQNGTTFSSVAPGSHSITVKSSAGCISPATSVTIDAQPATPVAPTVTPTQPTCTVATGTITISAPTGAGLTYSIDGSTYTNTSGIFTGLTPNTYSVTVKNATGCISPATSVTINAQPPTPAAPTLTPTQPTCTVATGSIVVTAPTGNGETYSLDGGSYQNGTTFSSVAPGSHSITVKSSAGCISPATSVTIDAQPPTPPAPTLTPTQPTCLVATGSIVVTAPTGNGETYSLDGGAYQNGTTFSSVAPGSHSITVKSSAGCISPATSVTINAQPATPPAPTLTPTQPTCAVATGSIVVTAPTGGGESYSLDGGAYQNGTTFSSVAPGSHSITVKSSAGCISPATSVTINAQPATPPAPTLTPTQPTCAVATGSIVVTAPTGGGESYSLDGGAYQNGTTFSSVAPGSHSITVKSSAGCISPATSVTIDAQPATPVAPTVTPTQPTCTVATGTITISAPTGAGLTYSIDGSTYTNTSGIFTGLTPNTYSVTVKNATGCISPATSVTINAQPPTPAAPTLTPTQPTCTVATGSIVVTAPTGNGETYSLDGGSYQNGTTFSSVAPGSHSITVKSSAGCISPATSVTIDAQPPTPPAPTLTPTQPTCLVATGSIVVTAPTGNGETYSLDGGAYQNGTTFSSVAPGSHSITVKSSAGCISPATSVTINAQPATPPAPTLTPTQPTCAVATGSIVVTAPTGGGESYSLDGGAYQNGTTFSSVAPGSHSITVKSSAGCISPATSVTINAQPATPPAPTLTPTQPTCAVATGSIVVTAPTGGGESYSLDGGAYQNGTTFSSVAPGSHSITVKSSAGCISPATSVTIDAQPATPVAPTVTPTQPTCTVATGTITISAPTGAGLTYSIDGSTYTNTSGIFTGLTPNTYSVTVKNATGCISPATSVTINAQPPTPAAPTLTPTQPTCTVATGSIVVTAPTGNGETYSLDGGSYQNGTTFSSVAPGSHSITVKSSGGCISPATSVTIDAQPPTPPAPTLTPTQPTCLVATGSIVVTAPTGNGETYSLDGGAYQNGTTFSSVAPGSHSITVKSSAGCISPATSVTINAQPATPPAPTLTPTQPTCAVATGSIVVTAPTGGGESYSLDGGAYQNGTTFSSVAPGSHSITVKSSAGCISPATSVTINAQPATPPAPTLTPTQPTCAVATGSIVVTAPTGGGESYSLDGGAYQNGTTFSSVAPGSHSITVKSSAGCISPATSVTINAQPATPPAPTLTPTQPTCAVATGSIVVTAPTGNGETYSLDGGSYQNGTTFSSVASGSHSITVKSSGGCISPATSVTIDAQPPTPPAPTLTPTQPTCLVATGSIVVTAPTGNGETYSLDGGSYQNGTTFSSVAPGSHSITVKSSGGCISPATSVTIDAQPPTPPAPTLTPTQPTCLVATGSIVVTAPTGNGETYSLDGGAYQNGTTFSSVAPGSHSITVKSSAGCISPATSVTINAQPATPPAPTLTPTQPTCAVATGSIVVTAPTGGGESYSLDGGAYQNGTTFSSVAPGSHSITVKSSAGCISPATSVTIDAQPATPPAPTATITQPTCTVATATITITTPTVSGLEYSINGTTYQSGVTFNNVNPGNHSLTVRNAAGCISSPTTVTVNVQPPTPPAPVASVTQPTCTVLTGVITVTTPSPSAGITYSIDGTTYTNTTGIFTALAPNTYSVTVKNSDGCISAPASVTVDAPPATPAAPTVSVVQPLSCSASTGTITVSAPAPASGISYSIDGTNYTNTTGIFSNVGPGTYSVTTKNGAGCISAPTSATVDPPPSAPPAPTASVTQQPTCTVPTGTITVNTPAPAAGLTYSIDGTTYSNTTGLFNNVVPGTYNITVKNAAGCISAAASVVVDAPPSAPAAPTASVTQPTCGVATGTITVTSPAPASGITYSIDGTAYTNTTGIFSTLTPGTYSLTTKNAAGCISAPTSVTVIGQPATPPAPVVTLIQPTCSTATGTITVTTPAPASGITYSIDGTTYTNTSGIFSNLTPATYSVTTKNSAGCISAPTSVTIDAAPSAPAAPVASVTQPTCATAAGTITITTPAPASGITYSIDGTTYTNTTGIFTGLTPNSYSLTVRNAAGCISSPTTVTVNVQPPTPPAPVASVTQPTCTVLTGVITVTTPSPSAGITYSIDGTTYTNTTGIFTALAPNTYSVTVKNSDGCISAPASVTVDAPPATPAAPTVSVVQPLSCSASTGTITVSAPAPASGISYSIDGTNYTNTTGIFSNVGPGTYSVTTKNGAGCISAPTSATVDPPPSAPPAPTASVTQQPTCTVPTGTITVNTPAPAAGLTYSIDGTTYSNTTGLFNNVVPGTYNITVKNAAGCISAAASVVVDAPPSAPAAPTASVTQPTCGVATGTITVTSPAPASGITYSIDGTAYTNTTGIFSTLTPGTYSLTTKNAAGCISAPTSVTVIGQPATPPAPVVTLIQPTCSTATGTITVTTPAPASGITYSIDGTTYTNTSGIFSNLTPATYSVTTKNSAGCISAPTSVTIDAAPSAPAAPVASVTQPTCATAAGTITITTPAPASGITYSIDGTTYTNTTGIFTGLTPNSYSLTVRNAAGCISSPTTVTVNVQPPTPPAPVASVTQPTCTVLTGVITVTTPSPSAGITYSIDGTTYTNTTGIFTALAPNTYSVTVKNSDGCISAPASVTVDAPPATPAAPTVSVVQPLSCSASTGTITVSAPAPASGISYSIDGTNYTNTTGIFSNVGPGTYSVTTKNGAGCISAPTSATVDPPPSAPPAPTASVTQQPTCTVPTGTITVNTPAPAAGLTYSIDGTTYSNTTGLFNNVVPGTYNITVKNAAGCISAAASVVVDAPPSAPAAPTASVTQPTCGVATGTILITSSTTGFEYSIDGGTFGAYPTGGFSGAATGKHTIGVRNAAGCSTTIDVTVNAQPLPPASPTTTLTDPTCSTPTGAITITSPTTGLQFSLDSAAYGAYPAAGYSGLSTGKHTIAVRNTDSCITTVSVDIKGAPGAPPSPTVSVIDPTCTVATGSIAITSSTTGFTYSLDGGAFTAYPSAGYSGLSTGKHTITTKNVDGCTTTIDVDIKGAPGAPAAPTASVTQPTCGVATGTILITSSTTGFEYSIDGGTFGAYPTGGFSGAATGKHTIGVRNAAGCSTTIDVTVNAQPLPPASPTTTLTDPTCSTPTGAITITSPTTGLQFSLDSAAYGAYPAAGYSGLSTGKHTIAVRNTDSCITTVSVDIKGAPGAPPSPTVSVIDPTCTVATGSIAITSSTTGFTYSLDGGAFTAYPSAGYSGLSTGKHTITTKNVDGCTTTIDVDIKGAPGAPAAPTASVTQPTCGVATGTILITSSTTGFEYSIDGGTFGAYPTGGFSGAATGKHTIGVRNAAGCSTTIDVTVNAQPLPPASPTTTLTDPTCSTPTGAITITSPTTGLQFSLDSAAYGAYPAAGYSGLSTGKHTIAVRNTDSCITTVSVDIKGAPGAPPSPTVSVIDPTCTVATGSIAITSSTTGFTYSLDGGAFTAYPSAGYSGLSTGKHTITTKNVDGCTTTIDVDIKGAPGAPAAPTASVTQPTCGVATGTILITSSTTGFEYSIDGGTFGAYPTGGFSGAATGKHTIGVRNAAGCSTTIDVTVNAQPLPPASPTTTLTDPTCSTPTGAITITSPTTGLQFSLDSAAYGAYPAAGYSGLSTGKHTIAVRNTDSCITTVSVDIKGAPGAPPSPTVSVIDPTCTVATGSIAITSSTTGFTYSLDGGAFTAYPSAGYSGLSTGKHTITTKNVDGCTTTIDVDIKGAPGAPAAPTASVTQPTCGVATGTILITSSTTGFEYSIDGGTFGAYPTGGFSGAATGKHTIGVRNAAGCSTTIDVTVNAQPLPPASPTTTLTDPTCSTPTGAITITSPTTGLQFSLDSAAYGAYPAAGYSGLSTGKHTIAVRNTDSCITTVSVDIKGAPGAPPSPTVSVIDPTCTVATGSIAITSSTTGFTYSLDGGAFTAYPSAGYSGLSTGKHTITTKNVDGCTTTIDVDIKGAPGAPAAPTASVTQPTCGVATGTILITSSTTGFEYSIDGGTFGAYPTGGFSGAATGKHTIGVRNAAGCSTTIDVTVNAQPLPPASPTTTLTDPTCSTPTGAITITSPTTGLQFSLDSAAYGAYPAAGYSGLSTGKHTIAVRNTDSCITTVSVDIKGAPGAPPSPTVSVIDPTCTVATGSIAITSSTTGFTYSLDGGAFTAYPSAGYSGLSTGKHTITTKNVDGCTTTIDVDIKGAPGAPAAPTASVTQPTCGVATGTILITSSTTGFEYSIDGGTFGAYPTGGFSGAATGKHTIGVRNAAGCSTTIDVTVNAQPLPPASPTTTLTDPTCSTPTGAITITSPTTGLQFSLDSAAYGAYPAAGYSGLSTGKHTIAVRNTDSCITTVSVDIKGAPGAPPSPTVSVIDPTCTVATGSIAITSSTTGFTYSLDGGAFTAYPSAGYSGLSTGKHTITTKNVDGCTTTIDVDIKGAPGAPAAPTASVTQPTCGVATGTILITSSTTGFEYSIDGGTFGAYPTGGFSGAATGKHTIGVRNAAGCSTTIDVTVNAQPLPPASPTTTLTDPTCSTPTGAITITSPTTGLQFSLDSAAYGAYPAAGYSGLSTGKHTIAVRNTDSCITTVSVDIKGAPGAPPSPTVSVIDPTCTVATGSIAITSSTTGFTYSLDGGAFTAYPSAGYSGLSTGKHTITTKNVDGCTTPLDVDVKGAPSLPPAPTFNVAQPTCATPTGTITITSSTASFEYSLDSAAFAAYPTGGYSSVSAGKHTITIRNTSGCTTIVDATVNAQPLPPATPTTVVTDPTCSTPFGTITITSAIANLQFSFDGGAYAAYPSTGYVGLSAGKHTIAVRNTDGCITTTSVDIQPAVGAPAAPTVTVTQPTCTVGTGVIAVTAPTGVGFTYTIDGTTYQSGTTFTNVAPGSYPVQLKNALGCISPITTVVIDKPTVVTRVTRNVSVCSGQSFTMPAGQVVSTTGIYTDTLKYAAGCDSLISTINLLVGVTLVQNQAVTLCPGQTYTLVSGQVVSASGLYRDTLKSAAGCDSAIINTTVTAKVLVIKNVTSVLCVGQTYTLPSGKVLNSSGIYKDTLKYTGGCDSLITNVDLTIKTVTRVSINVTVCAGDVYIMPGGQVVNTTGIYKDTLKYSPSGCDSLITTVNLIKLPTIFQSKSINLCPGQSFTLPNGTVANVSGIYSDTIRSVRGCDSLITQTRVTIPIIRTTNLPASVCEGETYKLPWGATVVSQGVYSDTIRSLSGCDSLIRKVTLTIKAKPVISVTKDHDVDCSVPSAMITATGASRYQWSSSQRIDNVNIANPVIRPRATATYYVTATGANGCVSQDSIKVTVSLTGGFNALVPSAFTPNNDGLNDCFGVSTFGFVEGLQFTVYNRWGNVVFQTTDPSRCWDGTYKGVPQDAGTYVYQASGKNLCGQIYQKGTVVLIR